MTTPITFETLVGYIVEEDVYVSYSEYYGDGTIYGRNDLLMPDGSPVKGAGKTKAELVNANVVLSEVGLGSVTGNIVVVPNDVVPEEKPVPEETPVPEEKSVPEETPVPEEKPVPEETPVPEEKSVPEETPVPEEKPAAEDSTNNLYKVYISVLGFEITREFTAKIDNDTRKIYLS
jgi:hypothetical protein